MQRRTRMRAKAYCSRSQHARTRKSFIEHPSRSTRTPTRKGSLACLILEWYARALCSRVMLACYAQAIHTEIPPGMNV